MVTSFHKPAIRDEQGDEAVSQNRLRIPEPVRIGRDSILASDATIWAGPVRGHILNVDLARPSLLGAKSNLNVYFSNRRGMLHPPSPG